MRLALATADWRALRDSNPCYRRERAVSWTARRRARSVRRGGREARRHIEAFGTSGKQAPPSGPARPHHFPVFFIDAHGSLAGRGSPFCSSSIECLSGERTKAIWPSRGGRLMVTPAFINRSHSA